MSAPRPPAPIYSADELEECRAWFRDTAREMIHTEISHLSVSEWATRKRILPQGLTALPGPFRWDVTPYLREIADCMSATSPVREVYVRKGAQVGYTVGVLENWIGYVIDMEPGPMMFVSADADVAEASVELRVDRMIQAAGLQGKIFSQSEKTHGKKTGDTKRKKEFPGGFLMAVGPNSGSKLRSFSIQYLAEDELDAWPTEVGGTASDAKTANEGDPHVLARRRQDAYSAISKTLGGSTPLIKQTSRIERLYLEGDQRQYYVPCKHCGEYQPLAWKQMRWDKDDDGRLVWGSVRYECSSCGQPWKNEDKAWFLPRGEWRPTAEPRRPGVRSYHLPSLLSPIGMRSWEDICDEWIRAQGDQAKLRVFVNTVLGETWEERGDAPPVDRVMLRRQEYSPEVVVQRDDGSLDIFEARLPEGPKIITLGADVQHDRIECELVAWGRGKESWSAGYHIFEGPTDDPGAGAWVPFREVLMRPDHGGLRLALALVDSGDQSAVVYSFVDRYFLGGVLPCKGASNTVGRGRIFAVRDNPGYTCRRIDLDEGMLKSEFYAATRVGPIDTPPEGAQLPDGYCHFPQAYDRRYFEKLYSETRHSEMSKTGPRVYWKRHGRNEALDCRAYALGALYVVAAEATGTDEDPYSVDWSAFWDLIESNK